MINESPSSVPSALRTHVRKVSLGKLKEQSEKPKDGGQDLGVHLLLEVLDLGTVRLRGKRSAMCLSGRTVGDGDLLLEEPRRWLTLSSSHSMYSSWSTDVSLAAFNISVLD